MTESQVVNGWISQGEAKGELKTQRKNVLGLLEGRFPGKIPGEIKRLVDEQDSLALLEDWFREAVRASTFEQFMAVLRR